MPQVTLYQYISFNINIDVTDEEEQALADPAVLNEFAALHSEKFQGERPEILGYVLTEGNGTVISRDPPDLDI